MYKLGNHTKLKKSEAFNILLEAARYEDNRLTKSQIDSLLAYFAPSKPPKFKDNMSWAAKACGINDVRYFLNFIRVDNGIMNGCDGHRLHQAATNLEDGYYCAKTLLPLEGKVIDQKYADVERIKPKDKDLELVDSLDLNPISLNSKEWVYKIGDYHYNKKYFDQAYIEGMEVYQTSIGSLVMRDSARYVLLMPQNVN